jgi:glucose/arabinose dehydrogenase
MRRLLKVVAALVLVIAAAWLFWPKRYTVNGPLLQYVTGISPRGPAEDRVLARLHAPAGFAITRFAADLPSVRFLRFTSEGDLLATQPRPGRVLLLRRDADGDGRSDGVITLLEGLDRVHGLDLHDGWLYVGESGRVRRIHFDSVRERVTGTLETVIDGLPAGGNHWTRTVRFGPDGALYVSVGSSCNVCVESDPRRAAILRYDKDGKNEEVYASGLRNSVGLAWRPETGELYATDNGRDLLGDDFPPCELNRIERGGFYGWPFANGNRVIDPDLGAGHEAEIARSIPPAHAFRAHNAALGLTFLTGTGWPAEYHGTTFVALHGSWNRTQKDGYKVVSLQWNADGTIREHDFLTGFLQGDDVIGRPVDVAEGSDGGLYVSDDHGGAIFRVAWTPSTTSNEHTVERAASTVAPSIAAHSTATFDAETIARGSALYDRFECALCHERDKAPRNVKPRPLVRLAERYDVAGLAAYLKTPPPPMPAFPMSDDGRRDLAAYLLSREPR